MASDNLETSLQTPAFGTPPPAVQTVQGLEDALDLMREAATANPEHEEGEQAPDRPESDLPDLLRPDSPVDPLTLSNEEFESWRTTASQEELSEFLARPDVIRGTRDYSRKSQALASDRKRIEADLRALLTPSQGVQSVQQAPPMMQPQIPPQPVQMYPGQENYQDPVAAQMAQLQTQLAQNNLLTQELYARVQDATVSQGREAIINEVLELGDRYPFLREGNRERELVQFMINDPRFGTAEATMRMLYQAELDQHTAQQAVDAYKQQLTKTASLPPMAPKGTRSRAPEAPAPAQDRNATIEKMAAALSRSRRRK